MTKKILISGPESSGKTTLAQQLAQHFDVPWQPEYAREYLSQLGRAYNITDLTTILLEQQQRLSTALSTNPPLIICDTGPEVFYIWSKVKYGQVAPEIVQQLDRQYYDLRLLCYPDLKWEADPLRETPDQEDRLALWQEYIELYKKREWPYTIINGKHDKRLQTAINAVSQIQSYS